MPVFKFDQRLSDILKKALNSNYLQFRDEFKAFLGEDEFSITDSAFFSEKMNDVIELQTIHEYGAIGVYGL